MNTKLIRLTGPEGNKGSMEDMTQSPKEAQRAREAFAEQAMREDNARFPGQSADTQARRLKYRLGAYDMSAGK